MDTRSSPTTSAGPAAHAVELPRPLTLAHDYFTQRGGAERVAAALSLALEPDRLVTAIYDAERTFPVSETSRLDTSFLQGVKAFRSDPRLALALLPLAWRLVSPAKSGVVLVSSSGWAHRFRVSREAAKVVYCHNPPRWLYQSDDYLRNASWAVRRIAGLAGWVMRGGDRRAAASADVYIANSSVVAARIRSAYGVDALVIHPPITLDAHGPQEPVALPFGRFYFTVARGRNYKNTESLVDAFRRMPEQCLVIVGSVPGRFALPPNVCRLEGISDAELRWLYARCTALISISQEDFGLTPLEANTFGSPALVLHAGGFLDSLADGVSGRYIERDDVDCVIDAVRSFPEQWDRDAIRAHAGRFSMDAFLGRLAPVLAGAVAAHSRAFVNAAVPVHASGSR